MVWYGFDPLEIWTEMDKLNIKYEVKKDKKGNVTVSFSRRKKK